MNQLFKLAQKYTYTTRNGSAIVLFMKQHSDIKFSFISMNTYPSDLLGSNLLDQNLIYATIFNVSINVL
jgi:hypothetical protein